MHYTKLMFLFLIESGKRFLNSGGFIGYAKDIYEIVTHHEIQNHEDDQLYYTKLYLDQAFREQHKFKLDHKSLIFQVIHLQLRPTKTAEKPFYEAKQG